MRTIEGFEMPDIGERAEFVDQSGRTVTVEVVPDDSPPNPLEDWDGEGVIHSFNPRHANFLDLRKVGCSSLEEAVKWLNEECGPEGIGWMRLGYFEHGRCVWFPWDGGMPPGTEGDFRWDGHSFAGVWVPDEDVMESFGELSEDELRRKVLEYCVSVCRTYTSWCNGDVYGYDVSVDGEDSCFGFFGLDDFEWNVAEVLSSAGVESLEAA